MIHLGLIGKDISHSKSQKMYEELLGKKINYDLMDYSSSEEIPSLDEIFQKVQGLSITSPYKNHFLNQVKLAGDFEAINCIRKEGDQYFATNTDALALKEILPKLIAQFSPVEIIVLGDGPMATLTLDILNNDCIQLSRKQNGALESFDFVQFSKKEGKKLILNACSRNFVYSGKIDKNYIFYDYNYDFLPHKNYLETNVFSYIDGIHLLKLQALHALKFWSLSP